MSNYIRVLPRDLFNEASLLKCYGKLWILLNETSDHAARFVTEDTTNFDIAQDESSGAIFVQNVRFTIHDAPVTLSRPLNARSAWPLYAETEDDAVAVFDGSGDLSEEFKTLISTKG